METRAELRQAIDQLNTDQAKKVMTFVQSLLTGEADVMLEQLKKTPEFDYQRVGPPNLSEYSP